MRGAPIIYCKLGEIVKFNFALKNGRFFEIVLAKKSAGFRKKKKSESAKKIAIGASRHRTVL